MAEPVFGSDVVLEMDIDGDFFPVLCATDFTLQTSPEFIEKTGPESGLGREFQKRIEEFSATASGLTKIENADTLTFFYMLQNSVRREQHTFKATYTDADGASKVVTFEALIGAQSITGPVNDFANCTIEFKITGMPDFENSDPPAEQDYEILSDWWQTINGQEYIGDGLSSGETDGTQYTLQPDDEILEVDYEGVEYDAVSGTPAPGMREYRFRTTPFARVVLPAGTSPDGTQRVFIEWKRPI